MSGADVMHALTAAPGLRQAKTYFKVRNEQGGEEVRSKAHSEAKHFRESNRKLSGLDDLHRALSELETKPNTCVVRGRFLGLENAQAEMESVPGQTRRTLHNFADQPVRWACIDVDGYRPLMFDPLTQTEEAIDEYLRMALPEPFVGAGYHWQLSSGMGQPGNEGKLKAHLWFWLSEPATCEQMKAWARHQGLDALDDGRKVDVSLFNPVHTHYTALPLFEDGLTDPVLAAGRVRSGLVRGVMSDEVLLDVPSALAAAGVTAGSGSGARAQSRQQRLLAKLEGGPLFQAAQARGLVKGMSRTKEGAAEIVCPRGEFHSDGGADYDNRSVTLLYAAHTGGYAEEHIKCQHASCRDVRQRVFREALGVPVEDGFTAIPYETAAAAGPALVRSGVAIRGDAIEVAGVGPEDIVVEKIAARRDIPATSRLTTDLANAGRLVKAYGGGLMVAKGDWYAFDGKRWVDDEADVYRRAYTLSRLIDTEIVEWEAKLKNARLVGSEDEVKLYEGIVTGLKKWAHTSEASSTANCAVNIMSKSLQVDVGFLDRDPWLLNCVNGIVDLRTGVLEPHDERVTPRYYITKLSPVAYDPKARAPLWESTLAKVTQEGHLPVGSRPLAEFLQRWFGYCATGSVREQKFVVHWGGGSNGKSTVLDTIANVLGDYAGTAAPNVLMASNSERHAAEIADFFGRRMVTAHESDDNKYLREGFVKHATGGDKLKARRLYGEWFEWVPTHKIQLLTNHKPLIKGQDTGLWRRILLMPYLASFGSAEQVATGQRQYLEDKLLPERLRAEMPGILAWLVRGAQDWFQNGLQPPEVVQAASRAYQADQDKTARFLRECCELDPGYTCTLNPDQMGRSLYTEYKAWCAETGVQYLSSPKFLDELQRLVPHFEYQPDGRLGKETGYRRARIVCGLRLLDDLG